MRLFIATAILLLSSAGHASETGSWIANHDQLMAMPSARRSAYLQEVRTIVTEFELNSQVNLPEATASLFDSFFLPEATAADIGDFQKANCRKGESPTLIDGVIYCIVTQSYNNTSGECPGSSISMAEAPALDGASRSFYKRLCFGSAYMGSKDNRKPDTTPSAQSSAAPADRAIAQRETGKGDTSKEGAAKDGATKDATAKGGPGDTPDGKAGAPGGKTDGKGAGTDGGAPSTSNDCKAIVPKCGANREEARKDFFGDLKTKKKCLFGGNISEYRGAQMKKGDCKPVANVTITAGKSYPCANGSVCNPLIFCVNKKTNKAFCAHGMEATQSCEQQAPKGKEGADCMNDFLSKMDNRAKNAWDGFLKDLKAICTTDQTSAKFHCGECQIMYTRIFALNSKFYGNLCQASGAAVPVDAPAGKPAQPATPAGTGTTIER